MFYIKGSDFEQLLEIAQLENVFHQELPYFAEPEVTPDTVLHLPNLKIYRAPAERHLVWNPETATWCFVNEIEYALCEAMRQPIRYGEFRQQQQLEQQEESAKSFLTHLYRRGLLALDGKAGIDQNIYTNGPFCSEIFTLEMMLTEKCNLACSYCFAEADARKEDMTFEVGKCAIDKMLALPDDRFIIKFSGGEPLLKFRLLARLMQHTMQANRAERQEEAAILFDITTNGTRLSEEVIAVLKSYPLRLKISFDGLSEIHDGARFYRSRKGSHKDVLAAIDRLRGNKIPFRVITVVRKPHLEKAEDLFRYCDDLGIEFVRFNPMIRSGYGGLVEEEHGITAEDYFFFMKQLIEYIGKHSTIREDNIQVMVRNLIYRSRDFRCMRSPCGAGKTYVNVDPQGNIHPCAYFRSSTRHVELGNVRSEDVALNTSYKNHRHVVEMARRTVRTIAKCSTCTWRHVCTGGCAMSAYLQYGDLNYPAHFCHFYRKMYPFLLQYLEKDPALATFLLPGTEAVMLDWD